MENLQKASSERLKDNLSGPAQPLVPLLLGQGKLARHLHYYLHLIDFTHKHFDDARDLKNPELLCKLRGVNAIWILTSDQAIEEVKTNLQSIMREQDLNPADYTWIHSSAATEIEGMDTIHPLMTFGTTLYTFEQYEKIPFAVISANAGVLAARLESAARFKNPCFQIASKDRALYHAYAVLMSNLPILLWTRTTEEANARLNLDPSIFDPILHQTLDNFLLHRGDALTGPIARKDFSTISKNLTALKDLGTQESPLPEIYQSFAHAFSPEPSSRKKGDLS